MFVLALLAFRNSLNEKKKMSETDNYYTCGTASLPQVKSRGTSYNSGAAQESFTKMQAPSFTGYALEREGATSSAFQASSERVLN